MNQVVSKLEYGSAKRLIRIQQQPSLIPLSGVGYMNQPPK